MASVTKLAKLVLPSSEPDVLLEFPIQVRWLQLLAGSMARGSTSLPPDVHRQGMGFAGCGFVPGKLCGGQLKQMVRTFVVERSS